MAVPDSDVREHLHAIKTSWIVLFGALSAAMAGGIVGIGYLDPPLTEISSTVFYVSALVNLGALLWAFALQLQLRKNVSTSRSPHRRVGDMDRAGRRASVALTGAGFLAVGAAVTTGEWINLLFLVPIFGYAALFFPTGARSARLLYPPAGPANERR